MGSCKTTSELGEQAAQYARAKLLSRLEQRPDLSLDKALDHLKRHLEASDQKVSLVYNNKKYTWKYSKKLPNHRVQLDALKFLLTLWDTLPSEKHDHTVDGGLEVHITRTIIEGEAK